MLPPQKWPPFRVMLTSHGNSRGAALVPPTMRFWPGSAELRPHDTSDTANQELKVSFFLQVI